MDYLILCRESSFVNGSSPARTDRNSYSNATSPRRVFSFSATTVLGAPQYSEPVRVADVSSYSGALCSVTARTYGAHRQRQRHASPLLGIPAAYRPCVTAGGSHVPYPSSPTKIGQPYHCF